MKHIQLIVILCFFCLAGWGQNVNVSTGAVTPLTDAQIQQRSVDSVARRLVNSNDSSYNAMVQKIYTSLDSIAGVKITQLTIRQANELNWAVYYMLGMTTPDGTAIDSAQYYLQLKH